MVKSKLSRKQKNAKKREQLAFSVLIKQAKKLDKLNAQVKKQKKEFNRIKKLHAKADKRMWKSFKE
jgi:hypothetical protein